MSIALDTMLAFEGLTEAAGILGTSNAASAKQTQLESRQAQEEIKAEQQMQKSQRKIAQTLDAQVADESTTGVSGPSFGAISKTSFDAFLNDENNIAMNEQFQEASIKNQENQNQSREANSIFTSLSNFGLKNRDSIMAAFGEDFK